MRQFHGIHEYREISERLSAEGMEEAAKVVKEWARKMAVEAAEDEYYEDRRAFKRAGLWDLTKPSTPILEWLAAPD